MIDPWKIIRKEEESGSIEVPFWGLRVLHNVSIRDGAEIAIVLYLFGKVKDAVDDIFAPTQEAIKFACVSQKTFYRVMGKLKQLGVVKKGNGRYDMSAFFDVIKSFDQGNA